MSPRFHFEEELLFDFAQGDLSSELQLLLSCHLAYCQKCAAVVALHEERAAHELLEMKPASLSLSFADFMSGTLRASAEGAGVSEASSETDDVPAFATHFPFILQKAVAKKRFRKIVPGFETLKLDLKFGELPMQLIRLASGFQVEKHAHQGREISVVLSGGFHEGDQGFVPGDVLQRDRDDEHSLRADAGGCVVLIASAQPIIAQSIIGKAVAKMAGL